MAGHNTSVYISEQTDKEIGRVVAKLKAENVHGLVKIDGRINLSALLAYLVNKELNSKKQERRLS